MKTIFVSSTIWDLKDARAEVREFLSRNGFQPIMSDNDDFPDDLKQKGTYEKCHDAVKNCDIFLMIVNSRYGGPREPKDDEISITHQEFRWAVEEGKDFLCFMRDSVEADLKTWKDNGKIADVKLRTDRRVLEMMEEIQTSGPGGTALWRETFKDSVDLKRKLESKLKINDFANDYIAQAQMLNALPRLKIHLTAYGGDWVAIAYPMFDLANTGSGTAEQVVARLQTHSGKEVWKCQLSDLPPAVTRPWEPVGIEMTALKDLPLMLTMTYKNVLGKMFECEYRIQVVSTTKGKQPRIRSTYFGPPK